MDVLYKIDEFSNNIDYKTIKDNIMKRLRCRPYLNIDNIEPALVDCKFAKSLNYKHILASVNDVGNVLIQNSLQITDKIKVNSICKNSLFCTDWCDSDMKMIAAGGNRKIYLMDVVNSGDVILKDSFGGHNFSIKCIQFKPQSSAVFASGGRDDCIMIWDSRNSKRCTSDISIAKAHYNDGRHNMSITSVLFVNDNYLVSTADGDPFLKVWDIRKPHHALKRPGPSFSTSCENGNRYSGFTNAVVNNRNTLIYANSATSQIITIDAKTFKTLPVEPYKGHNVYGNFYAKCAISSDDNYIASGSEVDEIKIWKIDHPTEPFICLKSRYTGVAGIDWSCDGDIKIASCFDFGYPLIWVPHFVKNDESDKYVWENQARYKQKYKYFKIPSECIVSSHRNVQLKTNSCKCTTPLTTHLHNSNINNSEEDKDKLHSVLSNLPNYVVDGVYQLPQCSSNRTNKENKSNWLTELSSKYNKQQKLEKTTTTTPSSTGKSERRSASSLKRKKSVPNFFVKAKRKLLNEKD